jgi:hypothetical protein
VRGGLTPVRNAGNDFRKGAIMTRNFVDRDMFEALIRATPRANGGTHKDIATIYGDISRLVVAWLANTDREQLAELYNSFGWGRSRQRPSHSGGCQTLDGRVSAAELLALTRSDMPGARDVIG